MSNSENSVSQRVISFTITYAEPVSSIAVDGSTTLESIGIQEGQDTVEFIMELEDSFGLTYESGDADGITTVGDAITLITNKLGN